MPENPYQPPLTARKTQLRKPSLAIVCTLALAGSIGSAALWSALVEARAVNRASDKHGHIKNTKERIHHMRQYQDAVREEMWPLSRRVYEAAALCSVLSAGALVWSLSRRAKSKVGRAH